jgi:Integrase zinc binding domain
MTGIQNTMEGHGRQTSTKTTRLHRTILPAYGCISIWRGSHTLTGGRIYTPKHQLQTETPPHRILLSYLYRNQMKLQHLRTRTPSYHESHNSLVTLPNLDKVTIHHTHGPCESLHWKSPWKLNRRTARWHGELQDYNFKLQHVLGKLHMAADALSQPMGADEGKDSNQQMTMIPEAAFIRLAGPDSNGSIEHTITTIQNHHRDLMEEWTGIYPIERIDNPDEPFWRDTKGQRLIIPPDKGLKRELMNIWHEGTINGHPGQDKTLRRINKEYFWPGAKTWIIKYIKGCATCQQNKNLTHHIKTPMFQIPSPISTKPFLHIAIDLITGLPKSEGHDAILTIVNHSCSRAALFLPCSTTITGAGIAQLYLEHLFRWFGLPQKIISD